MRRVILIVAVVSLVTLSLPSGKGSIASSLTTLRSPAAARSAPVAERGLLAPAPAPVLAGAALATAVPLVGAPEDLVFAFRGGETRDFWKYSISQDQWTPSPDAPAPVGDGAGLVEVSTLTFCSPGLARFCIAALRGNNTSDFWMFDIQANMWCTAPSTPEPVGSGGAIAQLQRLGEIYVLRGGGTTVFWKFDSRGRWRRLADVPGPVNAGGSLVGINYGTASQRDVLYALQGGGSTAVWKYDVAADSWSHQSEVPAAVGPGGAMTSPNFGGEGTLDVLEGGGSSTIWSLDIAANAWTKISDAPGQIQAGGTTSNQFNGCDFSFVGGGSTQFFSTGIRDCKAPVIPDFSLSFAQPAIFTSPGTKFKVTLNIVRTGGFTGSVTLLPPATLPNGIKLPQEFVATTEDHFSFKIKIKDNTQPGIYPLIFVGVGGGTKVHAAAIALVVQ